MIQDNLPQKKLLERRKCCFKISWVFVQLILAKQHQEPTLPQETIEQRFL